MPVFGETFTAFNYFRKMLYLKSLAGFWMRVEFEIWQGSKFPGLSMCQGFEFPGLQRVYLFG